MRNEIQRQKKAHNLYLNLLAITDKSLKDRLFYKMISRMDDVTIDYFLTICESEHRKKKK